jgi:hypothetical protein
MREQPQLLPKITEAATYKKPMNFNEVPGYFVQGQKLVSEI